MIYFTELNMKIEPRTLFRTGLFCCFTKHKCNFAEISWELHGSTEKKWD